MTKSIIALALAATLAFTAGVQAQTVSLSYSPRTGDVTLDTYLGDINTYGRGDPDYFYDDMVSSYGVPRDYVRELYVERRWAPGDIYYACTLAQVLGRPCPEIVSEYDRHPGLGWGALAQRMGIKPGSQQFHALKGRVGKGHGKFKTHGRGAPMPASGHPGKGGDQDRTGKGAGKPDKGPKDKGKGQGKGHGHR